MKAVLVTTFPEKFVRDRVLPDLRRRVEVLQVVAPAKAETIDFDELGPDGLVLHMTEFGSHSGSEQLSRVCRARGATIRALSRKKASWGFLPPPSEGDVANDAPESEEQPEEDPMNIDVASLELSARGRDIKAAREHAGWKQHELAELIGVTQSTISAYERGTAKCTDETIAKILAACNLPMHWRGMLPQAPTPASLATPCLSEPKVEVEVPMMLDALRPPMAPTPVEVELTKRVVDLEARLQKVNGECLAAIERADALQAKLAARGPGDRFLKIFEALSTLHAEGIITAEEVLQKLRPPAL